VNSPYVRRLRLAAELLALREAAGMTHEQVGKKIRQSRMKISRLENAHIRPDLADIMKILDALGVDGQKWHDMLDIARGAAERGWWEAFGEAMGERQQLYADLEAGAVTIREYHPTLVPGLLQTESYYRALADVMRQEGSLRFTPEQSLHGRLARQKMVRRPDGPTYEAVIDEVVVRRFNIPDRIQRDQLRTVIGLAESEERVSIRVLPVDAKVKGAIPPTQVLNIYTFADPLDPTLVVVDTVTKDLVVSEPADVGRYELRYQRLREAALSPDKSLDLLREAASRNE